MPTTGPCFPSSRLDYKVSISSVRERVSVWPCSSSPRPPIKGSLSKFTENLHSGRTGSYLSPARVCVPVSPGFRRSWRCCGSFPFFSVPGCSHFCFSCSFVPCFGALAPIKPRPLLQNQWGGGGGGGCQPVTHCTLDTQHNTGHTTQLWTHNTTLDTLYNTTQDSQTNPLHNIRHTTLDTYNTTLDTQNNTTLNTQH